MTENQENLKTKTEENFVAFWTPHTRSIGSFKETIEGINNLYSFREKNEFNFKIELKLLFTHSNTNRNSKIIDYLMSNLSSIPDRILLYGLTVSKTVIINKKDTFINISSMKSHVDDCVKKLINYGIDFRIVTIPLCILSPLILRDYIAFLKRKSCLIPPKYRYVYFDPSNKDGICKKVNFSNERPLCEECIFYRQVNICNVEDTYYEMHSQDDFHPIRFQQEVIG